MTIKPVFHCDICKERFEIRKEDGEPEMVGGINGMYEVDGKLSQIQLDFCPKCYQQVINFVTQLQHEQKKD